MLGVYDASAATATWNLLTVILKNAFIFIIFFKPPKCIEIGTKKVRVISLTYYFAMVSAIFDFVDFLMTSLILKVPYETLIFYIILNICAST